MVVVTVLLLLLLCLPFQLLDECRNVLLQMNEHTHNATPSANSPTCTAQRGQSMGITEAPVVPAPAD